MHIFLLNEQFLSANSLPCHLHKYTTEFLGSPWTSTWMGEKAGAKSRWSEKKKTQTFIIPHWVFFVCLNFSRKKG